MRHLQRRLDRLEGSGGSDGMFIVPLYHGDEDQYRPACPPKRCDKPAFV